MPGKAVTFDEWFPIAEAVYRLLGEGAVGIGTLALSLNLTLVDTKDVDFALDVGIRELEEVGRRVEEVVFNSKFVRIEFLEYSAVAQIVTVLPSGKYLGIEVFNAVSEVPVGVFDAVVRRGIRVLSLESWLASQILSPGGISRRTAERIRDALQSVNSAKVFNIITRALAIRPSLRAVVEENLTAVPELLRSLRGAHVREL